MRKACVICGTVSDQARCPTHRINPNAHRSPNRDRAAQARFRTALLKRAGHQCEACGETQDLRACHITPLARGGSYDPSNGRLLCRSCDMATDPYAR